MKKNALVLFLLCIFYFPNVQARNENFLISQDSLEAPVLLSPLNMSKYQRTKSLTLEWNSSFKANNYRIQYSLDSNFTSSGIIGDYSVTDTFFVLPLLKNKTTYYWRVRARLNFEAGSWSKIWSFTTTSLPTVPNLYFPENGLINREINLTFTWTGAAQNVKYIIQVSSDSTFSDINEIIEKSISDTTVELYNLNYHTVFFWRVKSLNIDNVESNWTNIRKFKTKLAPPAAIQPYGAGLDTALIFQWQTVESADEYRLQVSTDTSFTQTSIFVNKLEDSSGIILSSFKHANTYFWRVFALNFQGDSSDWSKIIKFQIKLATPLIILPKDNLNNVDNPVYFSWGKVDSAFNYQLEVSIDTSFNKIVIDTVQPGTGLSLSSFKHYTRYYWRVRAISKARNLSNWTVTRTFKTNLAAPYLFSNAGNFINSTDTVIFNWNKNVNADHYHLQISYDSLFTKTFVNELTKDSLYILYSLIPDTTFFARIMAINNFGDSSRWSNEIRFITNPLFKVAEKNMLDTLNISETPTDSIAYVTFNNNGPNTLFIDSLKVQPDSIFSINNNGLILTSGSMQKLMVILNRSKILPGNNTGTISFIRRNYRNEKQNYNLKFSFYVQKALPKFSPDTLDFGLVTSDSAGYNGFSLKNFGGNISIKITRIIQLGPDSGAFNLYNNPAIVKANSSNYLPIEFHPKKIGLNQSIIIIETNAAPQKNFRFIAKGTGIGGELSPSSISSIKSLGDSTFESLISYQKTFTLTNSGDTTLKLNISFVKNYWGFDSVKFYSPVIKAGDSLNIKVRYLARNFNSLNIDTMVLRDNGFGETPVKVILKGGFNKAKSIPLILSEMKIDNTVFPGNGNIYQADSTITIVVDSAFITSLPYPDFEFKYFMGDSDRAFYSAQIKRFHYVIPHWNVGDRGLVVSGELLMRNNNDKAVDSVMLFRGFAPRILINGYTPPVIKVPRSIPGQSASQANVKWTFFGFPFDTVYVDSIFNYFGGRSKMQDGEWMLYKYDATNNNSFSKMNLETFQPNTAYFFAQALVDTFRISKIYYRKIFTRSLTDTIISLPGNNWKTVSDPYTFNVQVESPNMLYKYNTGKQEFVMTNIMKPGEGYFIEPSINNINLKTYGKYTPSNIPKNVVQNGWYVSLIVKDKTIENNLLFSLNNQTEITKANANTVKDDYPAPPRIKKGLSSFIGGESGERYLASIKTFNSGSVWNVIVSNDLNNDNVTIYPKEIGNVPSGTKIVLFDCTDKKIIEDTSFSFILIKNELRKFKIIIGTEKFIQQNLGSIINQQPYNFKLTQNYPNPFNPSTSIDYTVPGLGSKPVSVQLKIYDILGNEIATLVNTEQVPGEYRVEFNASKLASGVYLYRLSAGEYTSTKKMLLLK